MGRLDAVEAFQSPAFFCVPKELQDKIAAYYPILRKKISRHNHFGFNFALSIVSFFIRLCGKVLSLCGACFGRAPEHCKSVRYAEYWRACVPKDANMAYAHLRRIAMLFHNYWPTGVDIAMNTHLKAVRLLPKGKNPS